MQNDVIALVKRTHATDEYGDTITERAFREVFAEVRSIGMREKYEALQAGLDPEFTFVLADYYDYDDEDEVVYEGKSYRVIRTFRKDHSLEIVCTRDASEVDACGCTKSGQV